MCACVGAIHWLYSKSIQDAMAATALVSAVKDEQVAPMEVDGLMKNEDFSPQSLGSKSSPPPNHQKLSQIMIVILCHYRTCAVMFTGAYTQDRPGFRLATLKKDRLAPLKHVKFRW